MGCGAALRNRRVLGALCSAAALHARVLLGEAQSPATRRRMRQAALGPAAFLLPSRLEGLGAGFTCSGLEPLCRSCVKLKLPSLCFAIYLFGVGREGGREVFERWFFSKIVTYLGGS